MPKYKCLPEAFVNQEKPIKKSSKPTIRNNSIFFCLKKLSTHNQQRKNKLTAF